MTALAALSPFAQAAADLIARGFHPVPIMPGAKKPGEKLGSAWRDAADWPRLKDRMPTSIELDIWCEWPGAGVGVVLGSRVGEHQLVAVDIDLKDPDAVEELRRALPYSPMAKRGAKGLTLFYRGEAELRTRQYRRVDRTVIAEILTGNNPRQTVVPPSIHPDTGKPYQWVNGSLAVRAGDLPILTAVHLDAFEELLQAHGWAPNADRPHRDVAPAPDALDTPFGELNAEALARLDAWVPKLDLYRLRRARAGFECVPTWRPGGTGNPPEKRKLNLSIQPNGIKDWGTGETFSALDLVMRARGCDFSAAWFWLDEALHGTPGPAIILPSIRVGETAAIMDAPEEPAMTAEDPHPDAPAPALDEALCFPKGLVGAISRWICETARKPQPALALAAAITIVGTAMGRQYAGPTGSGTHVYALGLAPTGAGKDHPLQQAKRIMAAAGMAAHLGPGEFISSTAAVNALQRMPLLLCVMDELGVFLGRINNRKAGGFEKAVGGILRTAWGSSFAPMPTPEWAQKRSSLIHAPALSLLGMSTPEEFFGALTGLDAANGVLNRFLIFPNPVRPRTSKPAYDPAEVPAGICEGLRMIREAGGPLAIVNVGLFDADPAAFLQRCGWGEGAEAVYQAFAAEIDARGDGDAAFAAFWSRAAEYAVRLATIHAVGRVGMATEVTAESIEWGIAVARASFAYALEAARDYLADTDAQARAQEIVRVLKARRGRATHRELYKALDHKYSSRDVRDTLQVLIESGRVEVREEPNPQGRPTLWYRLA
jgi:hypothetical protein